MLLECSHSHLPWSLSELRWGGWASPPGSVSCPRLRLLRRPLAVQPDRALFPEAGGTGGGGAGDTVSGEQVGLDQSAGVKGGSAGENRGACGVCVRASAGSSPPGADRVKDSVRESAVRAAVPRRPGTSACALCGPPAPRRVLWVVVPAGAAVLPTPASRHPTGSGSPPAPQALSPWEEPARVVTFVISVHSHWICLFFGRNRIETDYRCSVIVAVGNCRTVSPLPQRRCHPG